SSSAASDVYKRQEQDGIIKPWMGGEISLRSAEK
ncbi:hypothetical protein ACX3VG_28960, partial [Escherichia coli]